MKKAKAMPGRVEPVVMYEYRVCSQRVGQRKKIKRFASLKMAQRRIAILSDDPWAALGLDPDDKFCCDSYMCGCGGMTNREKDADYKKDLPALEYVRIEKRAIGEWDVVT